MNKRQSIFSSMCLTLSHFYTKYEAQIRANPLLSRLFDEFFAHYGTMNEAIQIQLGHTSEAAKLKQKEEEEMIEAVCRLANKAYVYATEKELPGLVEKFNVSAWELKKMGDIVLYNTCLSIYNAMAAIAIENLAEYGVAGTDITGMKKEIDDFHALISVPRSTIITRSQATSKINEEMKLIQTLLSERLDKSVSSLPDGSVVMKNEYKAARVVVDRSNTKAESDSSNATTQPKAN